MSYEIICTREQAIKEVNKLRKLKHVRFRIFVRPFLPTENNMGFEGCSLVKVSKKQFLEIINDLLNVLEQRGAKIKLTIPEEDFESFII